MLALKISKSAPLNTAGALSSGLISSSKTTRFWSSRSQNKSRSIILSGYQTGHITKSLFNNIDLDVEPKVRTYGQRNFSISCKTSEKKTSAQTIFEEATKIKDAIFKATEKGVKDTLDSADKFKKAFKDTGNKIKEQTSHKYKEANGEVETIKDRMVSEAEGFLNDASKRVNQSKDEAKRVSKEKLGKAKDTVDDVARSALDTSENVSDAIKSKASKAQKTVSGAFNKAGSEIQKSAVTDKNVQNNTQTAKDKLDNSTDQLRSAVDDAKRTIESKVKEKKLDAKAAADHASEKID